MDMMELKEALQERVHGSLDDVINQFDVVGALGLDVVDADLWHA